MSDEAGIDTPPDWERALQHILASGARRIMLLGPTDAGKSSFCRLLLARAARAQRPVALLDADLGQKQLGPPACVTLGHPAAGGPELDGLAFVGTTEPLRGWRRLIAGTVRLKGEAGAALLVINTSGLLRGAGRRLKAAKIAALGPDLLIPLGADAATEAVLADHAGLPALRLARAPLARRKGEGERRALRRAAFQAYFAPAPVWSLPLGGLHLEGEDGQGLPAPGRLAALVDEAGRDMALALVLAGDGSLQVQGPQPRRPVAGLRWGRLSLDAAWREHWAPQPSA
ncbi:Clp1/GlmU family protein [Roseomonas sp. E05]|uniref:Clp1/GlmU family protein n=1 Tax=Roseomonas sp. E05 TaxID=3046310 RepID=UPI0024BAC999|nr:Clp1/GlmU family protein [Roseomonas sp. E05]MDJ0389522.1 Clp1/GlmU family protein [Roseomonas sp. E05]